MFKLVWLIGFLMAGAPHFQTIEGQPTDLETCHTELLNEDRMMDWARGRMGFPLDFPLAIKGECVPVLRDASNEGRDPRCDSPARYEAMREGADCS
jgi:hypothetical protein